MALSSYTKEEKRREKREGRAMSCELVWRSDTRWTSRQMVVVVSLLPKDVDSNCGQQLKETEKKKKEEGKLTLSKSGKVTDPAEFTMAVLSGTSWRRHSGKEKQFLSVVV